MPFQVGRLKHYTFFGGCCTFKKKVNVQNIEWDDEHYISNPGENEMMFPAPNTVIFIKFKERPILYNPDGMYRNLQDDVWVNQDETHFIKFWNR